MSSLSLSALCATGSFISYHNFIFISSCEMPNIQFFCGHWICICMHPIQYSVTHHKFVPDASKSCESSNSLGSSICLTTRILFVVRQSLNLIEMMRLELNWTGSPVMTTFLLDLPCCVLIVPFRLSTCLTFPQSCRLCRLTLNMWWWMVIQYSTTKQKHVTEKWITERDRQTGWALNKKTPHTWKWNIIFRVLWSVYYSGTWVVHQRG